MQEKPAGWLLVDKPQDWTSFDVVNKIRGTLARELGIRPRQLKVGHAGTLDPIATGLLLIAVGKATKEIDSRMKLDKTYLAEMTLGANSTTGDSEGELSAVSVREPSEAEVVSALEQFQGEIEQIPPKYSAIKIDGVAAYKRARRGEDFEVKKRRVMIHEISLEKYEYPIVTFRATVSSGTYIRTLIEDLGETLETGAHMTALRRESIGSYSVDDAIAMSQEITAAELNNALKQ